MVSYVSWLSLSHVTHTESRAQARVAALQTNTSWHLQAISTRVPVVGSISGTNYTYSYNLPVGDSVDIYIVDTGVYIEHDEFEGRARDGWIASGLDPGDTYGHGTHMAGLTAGKTYGVAKNATVISVKVGEYGFKLDDVIAGLNWVTANTRSTGRPSIACLGIYSNVISGGFNDAVTILSDSGVTVVVPAGNNNINTAWTSPASAGGDIVIVGSSNITNKMAPWSNYGLSVTIWAPGVAITSASIGGGPTFAAAHSGTSTSTGIVAGIAAYFLSQDTSLTPFWMNWKIGSTATNNVITDIPGRFGTRGPLVFNGVSP